MTAPSDALPQAPGAQRRKIVLIAKHFGPDAGGEAIKAYHFAAYLQDQGAAPIVITHARAVAAQGGGQLGLQMLVVRDTLVQKLLWRLPLLRGLLDIHFHLAVRRLIRVNIPPEPGTTLHYIGPVSPVAPRFFPMGYDVVLGPLTGNISYPPAFWSRMSRKARLAGHLHALAQRCLRVTLHEKQRARIILVSGYERTRESLRLAGAREAQMIDVVDAGVSNLVSARPRIVHAGSNPRFVCSGRMVDYKGFDLAIRAVAQTDPGIRLDIYGDGETRAPLEALAQTLGVEDRVQFLGWFGNAALIDALRQYRAYVFPTLAEANGIAMQEAMMLGLPVIATRWGGPAHLADDAAAWYVDPTSPQAMIDAIAQAMTCLAHDADRADSLSRHARAIAEARFTRDGVSRSWIDAAYGVDFFAAAKSDGSMTYV